MKLVRKLEDLDGLRGGAVSIGNFDGVHRGHARIVERLRMRADQSGGPAVVFTFDPHPVRLLRPRRAPPPLTWTRRKADLLSRLSVDGLVAYPTDEALLRLSPREFFERIVVEQLRAAALVEGPNFFFGHQRAGNTETLQMLCDEYRIGLDIVPPEVDGGDLVSSSRIRAMISAGDVAWARHMLTQPYRLRGMITHGVGRGARLGFPTANLDAIDTLIPGHGVYAGRAFLRRATLAAAIHIGPNLTFEEDVPKVEVHLIDFDENIYGEPLEVDFLQKLRDIHPFGSVEALLEQLRKDVAAARLAHEPMAP